MGGRLDFIGSGVGAPENVVGARMKSRCGVVECARGRLTGTVDRIGGARPISATFPFTSAAVSESLMRAAVAIPGVRTGYSLVGPAACCYRP
jgi:hypothetical protein